MFDIFYSYWGTSLSAEVLAFCRQAFGRRWIENTVYRFNWDFLIWTIWIKIVVRLFGPYAAYLVWAERAGRVNISSMRSWCVRFGAGKRD